MTIRDGKLEFTPRELALGKLPPWALLFYMLWDANQKLDAILTFLITHAR